jgi:glycosyltransferase involved in cell wall biosynthesis
MELTRRGNRVYFINPPAQHVPGGLSVNQSDQHENLFIVDYSVRLRGRRFLPRFLMRLADSSFLNKLESTTGKPIDIVWNFENSRFYDLDFAGKKVLKIYFQVDENQDFHPAVATATADIALAINNSILETIKLYNKNCFLIPHSFQGHLSPKARKVLSGEYEYKRPPGPLKVLYVGNLDNCYLDTALLEQVINENMNVEFILVGPVDTGNELYKRLAKLSNVKFTGKVSFKDIPGMLDEADALMLVYNKTFTHSSHKLLEYLASGKTIISTYMSEHAQTPSLVSMCKSHEEYPQHFRQVLADIEESNSTAKMQARIRFALDNTYSSQLDKLEKIIDNLKLKNKS